MTGKVDRKQAEYQRRNEQWQAERAAYIALHGRDAWDALVAEEVAVLYPESPEITQSQPKP